MRFERLKLFILKGEKVNNKSLVGSVVLKEWKKCKEFLFEWPCNKSWLILQSCKEHAHANVSFHVHLFQYAPTLTLNTISSVLKTIRETNYDLTHIWNREYSCVCVHVFDGENELIQHCWWKQRWRRR